MESLYVCSFSTGHIKVGRANDAAARVEAHLERVACLGVTLRTFKSFVCVGSAVKPEAELIEWCAKQCSARFKNEWFDGLDFVDVCATAAKLAKIDYAPPDESDKPEVLTGRALVDALLTVNVEEVAKLAGVTTKTVYRIRSVDGYYPNTRTAEALSNALDLMRATKRPRRPAKAEV